MKDFVGVKRTAFDHWVFDDALSWKTWTYILSRAQYSPKNNQVKINGYWVEQEYGEFIYGRTAWSVRLKIPEQKLRTIMKRLEKDDMIRNSKKDTPRCSVYLVVNYAKFNQRDNQRDNQQENLELEPYTDDANQPDNQLTNQRTTSEQPANNQRLTTIKKDKKEKTAKKSTLDLYFVDDPDLLIAFTEYVEHRKLMKKQLNQLSAEKSYKSLMTLSKNKNEQIAIIDQSIASGWQGLFPLKNGNTQAGQMQMNGIPKNYTLDEIRKNNGIFPLPGKENNG